MTESASRQTEQPWTDHIDVSDPVSTERPRPKPTAARRGAFALLGGEFELNLWTAEDWASEQHRPDPSDTIELAGGRGFAEIVFIGPTPLAETRTGTADVDLELVGQVVG